jgi:hypothetical protein
MSAAFDTSLRYLERMFRKRCSFDDGSFIEYLDREALLYAEPDGHRMAVNWWFGKGLVKRVLYDRDITEWEPPHQAEVVSLEKREDIKRKVAEYCKQHRIRLEVKPGTSRLSESELAGLLGTLEFTPVTPKWDQVTAGDRGAMSFPDGSSIEFVDGDRILYVEPDGHRLTTSWTFVGRFGKRLRIRIDPMQRWEAPYEAEPLPPDKEDEIRKKVAEYTRRRPLPLAER